MRDQDVALANRHDLQNFPGTAAEKLVLMRTANARGLIAWSKARGRYKLTRAGWREVAPKRGVGLASLVVCTSMGVVIGAGALAAGALGAHWLPADASHRPAGQQAPAPVSRPVDPGGGLRTPPQMSGAPPGAPKVLTDQVPAAQPDAPVKPAQVAPKFQTDPIPTAQPDAPVGPARAAPKVQPDPPTAPQPYTPMEPVRVAEHPVPAQPSATATPTGAKHAAVKKPRQKTVRARTHPTWASTNSYRDERYSFR
jgi:hypothetical protein